MNKLTPREKQLLEYMIRVERMNFATSGEFGIYPNANQLRMVFNISRQRVHVILSKIKEHLKKHLNQK